MRAILRGILVFLLCFAVSLNYRSLIELSQLLVSDTDVDDHNSPTIPDDDAIDVTNNEPYYKHIFQRPTNNSSTVMQCLDLVELCQLHSDSDKSRPVQPAESMNHDRQAIRTLALGDPWLRGGFRNQYIRFTSLIGKSWVLNHTQLLLPSLKWYAGAGRTGYTVPFEFLYDVDHWNEQVEQGVALPKLVPFDPIDHFEWNPETTIFYSFCDQIDLFVKRAGKVDYRSRFGQHPVPYGSGTFLGQLWLDYQSKYNGKGINHANGSKIELEALERLLFNTMRPAPAMRGLIDGVRAEQSGKPYIALHGRFEPEMLVHSPCQDIKVRNMTAVLDDIRTNPDFVHLENMFVAINMPMMVEKPYRYATFQDVHKANLGSLQSALANGLVRENGKNLSLWLAGELVVKESGFVDPCMVPLVSSFIDNEFAVSADIFVGTYISTWSWSVWKARFYRGLPNYQFTLDGIKRVEGHPAKFRC